MLLFSSTFERAQTLAPTQTVSFAARRDFIVGTNPHAVAAGDFNQDGVNDLAVANTGDNTVSVLLGSGAGTFRPALILGTGSHPWSVAVGDFNNDGWPDLAVANNGDNTVSVLLGNPGGTSFQPALTFNTGTSPTGVVVGDFDLDGKQDLAVPNYGDNTISVLLGNGDGTSRPASAPPVSAGSSPQSMVVGDFNGDGRPDLAVADYGANVVSVLLGNGNGTFRPAATTSGTGNGPWALAVADFDGDGKLD